MCLKSVVPMCCVSNNNNNNNNKHLYSACSTECAHRHFTANYYYYPWSIGLETIIYHHIPCCLYGAGGVIQPYNILHYQTRQYTLVSGLLKAARNSSHWVRSPAIRVTVEHSGISISIFLLLRNALSPDS